MCGDSLHCFSSRQAAELLDQGHPAASAQCAIAKKMATDQGKAYNELLIPCDLLIFWICCLVGFEVCNDALQMLGGYGYLKVVWHIYIYSYYQTFLLNSYFQTLLGLRHWTLRAWLPRAPDPRGHQRDHASHHWQSYRQQIICRLDLLLFNCLFIFAMNLILPGAVIWIRACVL